MIPFTSFELQTPLHADVVKEKLLGFIDTGSRAKPDLSKGYIGQVNDQTFTLRMAYIVQSWYYNRQWEKVRIRNAPKDFNGQGIIIPQPSGTSLKVQIGLLRSAWIIPAVLLLFPVVLAAGLHLPMGISFLKALGIAELFAAFILLPLSIIYYISLLATARSMKRDLQALLNDTWKPMQVSRRPGHK